MRKALLPGARKNAKFVPSGPLGLAIHAARVAKQIPQRVLAEAIAAKCGGNSSNVRVSTFERCLKLPNDAELTVLAQVLGLSVASLREKREASHSHKQAIGKAIYEEALATGRKQASFRKPKATKPASRVKAAKPAKLASVPALADLVEQIDEIAPIPADKDARKRWFQCVSMLSRIGAAS